MPTNKQIRVFLSSTFKGMEDERDIIVKKVFPRLRVEAEKRGIIFSYVDLRWGVAPNAKPTEIIDVCTSEIENCIPFFLGLIGFKYGTLIPDIDKSEVTKLAETHKLINAILEDNKKFGYTELEIRYNLLFSKEKNRSYFYIKGGNSRNLFYKNKGCLLKFLPFSSNKEEANNQSLELLKEYVRNNYPETTKDYPEDTSFENSKSLEDLVYDDLMSIISKISVPAYPENEFVRLNQEHFLDKQEWLVARNNVQEVLDNWVGGIHGINNDCTEILLYKGEFGSGRTTALVDFIKKPHKDLNLFYHFVGVSLKQETPELILKDLIAQICKYLGIDEPSYTVRDTKEVLCKYLTCCLQKINNQTIIIIDDIDAIVCDTNSLMSIISWLPTGIKNLGYIFSLSQNHILLQECPLWIRKTEVFLPDLTSEECHEFAQKYLSEKYGKSINGEYGDKKEEILTPSFFDNPEKLFLHNIGLLKLFLDEIALSGFGEDKNGQKLVEIIKEKSKYKRFVLGFAIYRIENELFKLDEKAKAIKMLSVLSIADYGIYENDIVDICSGDGHKITQIDWSKLFCQIKSFIITEGYIKLSSVFREIITQRYLWRKEELKELRVFLAKRMELLNINNCYSIEIVSQYLKAEDFIALKLFLSDPQIITFIYRNNNGLLLESLKALNKQNLLDDIDDLLLIGVDTIDNKDLRISLFEGISDIFLNCLPKYNLAIRSIIKAIDLIKQISDNSNAIRLRLLYNYYSLTILYTLTYRLNDAQDSINNLFGLFPKEYVMDIDSSLYIECLKAQAQIYTHNTIDDEKRKAIPILFEAIELDNNRQSLNYISLLSDYANLMYYYLHDIDSVMTTIGRMKNINNNIPFGSIIHYRAILYLRKLEWLELEIRQADINEYIDYSEKLLEDLNGYIDLYGRVTRESIAFYKQLGETFCIIARKYYQINNYTEYVRNIDKSAQYYEQNLEAVQIIYEDDSKIYSDALHELIKVYLYLIETRPFEKEEIFNKCISCCNREEAILKRLFPNGSTDLARLYHNVSSLYKDMTDFAMAKTYIEDAIKIKSVFMGINEKSLHDSYIRRLIIIKSEITIKEERDPVELEKYQKYISDLISATKADLILEESEKEQRIQEIQYYQSWLNRWKNDSKDCYLEHANELFEVIKKMLTDFQVRMKDDEKRKLQGCVVLFQQWQELNSYIKKHKLEVEFDQNADYNNFKPLMKMILDLFNMMSNSGKKIGSKNS